MKGKHKTKFLKRIKLASALFAVMLIGGISVLPVSAGLTQTVIDNSSFAESISNTQWTNPERDLLVENGKIVFPAESTEDTRLITQEPAKKDEGIKELFRAEYGMRFKQLPQGEKFILGFSLSSIEAFSEEAGNLEVAFKNAGGIKVDVLAYDEDGEKQVLAQSVTVGASIGSEVEIQAYANADMQFTLTINEKTIFNGKVPIDLSGRIGFMQSGNCAVEISDLHIVTSQYNITDGCNVTEDFEKGRFNANAFFSEHTTAGGVYPAGIQVEDYNGSKVLMFRNAYIGYFSTLQQYSNFELTFDVPYMLNKEIKNEIGETVTPAHSAFAVAFGKDAYAGTGWGVDDAHTAFLFKGTSVSHLKDADVKYSIKEGEFFDASKNEGYSVRVTMIDTHVTVELKPLAGDTWTEIISYQMMQTPTGYVQIRPYGIANFAVDNVKIVNKDAGATPKVVEFAEGGMPGAYDWEYEPMKKEYRPGDEKYQPEEKENQSVEQVTQEEQEINWYLVAAIATTVVILSIVVFVLMKQRKRKMIKGGNEDEMV